MRHPRILPCLLASLLSLLAMPSFAQEARSLGVGQCGTALDWGPSALVWNPAALQFSSPPKGWALSVGGTMFDATNTGDAALDFTTSSAARSSSDPVLHTQTYRGLTALQMKNVAGGILYDQDVFFQANQGALDFLSDRSRGNLRTDPYVFSSRAKEERIETLALGYAQSLPLGQMSAALGGTLKIHQGTRFRQANMDGAFTTGVNGGYNIEQWSAQSGSGFSWDTGILVKPSSNVQVGYFMEDVNSSFKWRAEHSVLSLDPTTGAASSSEPEDVTITSNRPRVNRLGFTLQSQDHTSTLTGDGVHEDGETHWHFGFERLMAQQHLAIRFGTFKDSTSDKRIWTAGLSFFGKSWALDLGAAARKFPVVQDSSGIGAGLGFSMVL